jgi:hypothetical protein
MKKGILVLAGLSILLFFSCKTTAGIVFDDSVPLEQSAWIECSIGTITGYNGIAVNWEQDSGKMVQIPAGDTLLEWNVSTRSGNTNYSGKDMLLRYDFQAQKQYFFIFKLASNGTYGVNIFTCDFGKMVNLYRDHFEFVPFLNAQGNQRTVLE